MRSWTLEKFGVLVMSDDPRQHIDILRELVDLVEALDIGLKSLPSLALLERYQGGVLAVSRRSASVRLATHDAGSSWAVTPCLSSRRANWWTFSTLN
jgi:hypothetical protein